MPLLIVTDRDTKLSRRFLVLEERFAIGRLRTSVVPLRDKSVSKTHVLISRTPSGYIFQDLFSRNGTYVNEERRDSGTLKSGDVLRLGKINITFLLDEEAEREASAGGAAPPLGMPDPLSDTQLVAARPGPAPPRGESPPANLPHARAGNSSRAAANLVVRRSTERRMRVLASAGTGLIGILIGILIARMDHGHRVSPPGPAATAPPAAKVAVDEPSETAIAGIPAPQEDREPADVAEEGRIREDAATLRGGLHRSYSDPDESLRMLHRLFLDVLDRAPTRGEEGDLLPIDPAGRWRRVMGLARTGSDGDGGPAPAGATEAFRRFLGRKPGPFEERVLLEAAARAPASGERSENPGEGSIEAGLLITASPEYASAEIHRVKSPRQKARSLIVDLLDRPPAGDGEALDVEKALERFPTAKVARVLLASPDGARALAGAPVGTAGARDQPAKGLRDWVRSEIRRFLLRSPTEPEIDKVMEEVGKSESGAARLRIALSGMPEYRIY